VGIQGIVVEIDNQNSHCCRQGIAPVKSVTGQRQQLHLHLRRPEAQRELIWVHQFKEAVQKGLNACAKQYACRNNSRRDEATMAGWSQPFTVRQRQQTMMSDDQAHQTSSDQDRPKQDKRRIGDSGIQDLS